MSYHQIYVPLLIHKTIIVIYLCDFLKLFVWLKIELSEYYYFFIWYNFIYSNLLNWLLVSNRLKSIYFLSEKCAMPSTLTKNDVQVNHWYLCYKRELNWISSLLYIRFSAGYQRSDIRHPAARYLVFDLKYSSASYILSCTQIGYPAYSISGPSRPRRVLKVASYRTYIVQTKLFLTSFGITVIHANQVPQSFLKCHICTVLFTYTHHLTGYDSAYI